MYVLLRMYVCVFFYFSRRSVSSWMPSQFEFVVYIVYGVDTLIYCVFVSVGLVTVVRGEDEENIFH